MSSLPYVTSPGNIDKALKEIKKAAVPERVSQDFVKTILKIPGGSGDQMTSFLKKLGLANPDGSPNDRYRKFRNPSQSGTAIAEAIRHAYAPLYKRNEFMHEANESDLIGLVVEETGLAHDSNPVKLIVSCIKHLKAHASFGEPLEEAEPVTVYAQPQTNSSHAPQSSTQEFGMNLSYTINLNLPATSDPAVFDAIFKSLKENLLRRDDA
ncbi:MAG: DUF5343 domain-containing protein [Alphaproteobacteria bacterium]|nr:DUF5343 domain-containing protein [Alphaproteobacteria bacterium]MDX5368353.1 DUF5343 domain-containing protein [Alphaproteobacteria bacterium]MDX5463148.1 DUF5343 domain-containing protein [Alphaproteobacteria bacterium]